MATIEQRGATFRAKIRRQGAPALSRTFDTRADAEAWGEATEAAIRAGTLQTHTQRTAKLGDLLIGYRDKVTPTRKGHQAEFNRIEALRCDRIAAYSLENLSRQAFRDYRDRRLQSVTGSTVNRELALLSVCLKWARAELDAPTDPGMLDDLKQPENPSRERRLEPGEYERLMAAAPGWLQSFIALAVETAMRRGELAALEWGRIDLQRRVAVLVTSKNGSGRRVPLSSAAVRTLEAMPRPICGGKVFDMHPDAISGAFIDCCKKAGVTGLRLHDLRGEAVSRLFEKGLDMNSVKSISGHKSSVFMRYMRVGDVEALAQKLG